jgi:hypothetical protein
LSRKYIARLLRRDGGDDGAYDDDDDGDLDGLIDRVGGTVRTGGSEDDDEEYRPAAGTGSAAPKRRPARTHAHSGTHTHATPQSL